MELAHLNSYDIACLKAVQKKLRAADSYAQDMGMPTVDIKIDPVHAVVLGLLLDDIVGDD